MERILRSGDLRLAGHLSRPRTAAGTAVPGLVIAHGFPHLRQGGRVSAKSFPELADRIATEMGWMVLVFNFRGAGDSDGDFSLEGWRQDLLAAAAHLRGVEDVHGVWVAGFGTGGSLAISATTTDPELRGVAAIAAPADFDDWSHHPRRLLQHARDTGIIGSSSFPPNFDGERAGGGARGDQQDGGVAGHLRLSAGAGVAGLLSSWELLRPFRLRGCNARHTSGSFRTLWPEHRHS